jgi:polyhydroxyalkanoate synthesis regulator phasin
MVGTTTIVIIIIVIGLMFLFLGDDIRQFFYKNERIKKVTGNARDNIRILNRTMGTVAKPLEIEQLTDTTIRLTMYDTQPPFQQTTREIDIDQLQHDKIRTLYTGRVDYWIETKSEAQEYRETIAELKKQIIQLEGTIRDLEANKRQDVQDIINQASQLATSSKKEPPIRKL